MNYANLNQQQLYKKIRELQFEGIDAVYLNKEEWRELQINILDWMDNRMMARKSAHKGLKHFQYKGMKFYFTEQGFSQPNSLVGRAMYRAMKDVYEVNQKGKT